MSVSKRRTPSWSGRGTNISTDRNTRNFHTVRYRFVPLHDHLIAEGLLDYKDSRKRLPLFYNPGRSRVGRIAGRHFRKAGEHLARWIRSEGVGVTDKNVAPNHGWRHRFSSLARHVDMHMDVQNIIQGHAGDKVASDYGDA
jgi:integrase